MIDNDICSLVSYALTCDLIKEDDIDYCVNRLLAIFGLPSIEGQENIKNLHTPVEELPIIIDHLCDYAVEKGIIETDTVTMRDLFDTELMDVFIDHPTAIINKFNELYKVSPESATNWYYKFAQDTNYIRRYRIKNDEKWTYESEFGTLDITINLSKPEKDPKDIAAAKTMAQTNYPKCALCKENVGFAGSVNQQARNNHRIIPLDFHGERWYLQYSPYVYYNEHCIVFNEVHTPMTINPTTFDKLLTFIDYFPHYTIGSNADLPIVGGSILTHEHYQGGRYIFPLQKAKEESTFKLKAYPHTSFAIVHWPMSVIRATSKNKEELIEACSHILEVWRGYTDEKAYIYAKTNGELHNTITPIATHKDGKYIMDLVLRNNITTEEHPLGLYHPHAELHHIKKENIGLIEVMGLAILPARLKQELNTLADLILADKALDSVSEVAKHAEWATHIKETRELNKDNILDVLHEEVGKVFCDVLKDAGVYKCNLEGREAFKRFIDTL